MGLSFTFISFLGLTYLPKGPVQIAVFCLFQGFAEKEYQMESKRNETFARDIFGENHAQRT